VFFLLGGIQFTLISGGLTANGIACVLNCGALLLLPLSSSRGDIRLFAVAVVQTTGASGAEVDVAEGGEVE